MDTASQDGMSANSQNTSGKLDEDKKKMDGDGPNVSKKKRKTRGRKKKQQHSKRHDVDDRPHDVTTSSTTDDASQVVASSNSSETQPEPKTETRSGSKKRFSGFFKRKSRSESRSRSTSETNLSKLDKHSTSKRHQSAEDIKRGTTTTNTTTPPSETTTGSYVVYDVTRQPRNRLQRMTVRDAVRERRRYASGSRQRLTLLEKQLEMEECVTGSSLPNVSSVGLDVSARTTAYPTNVNVRGSASLPRQKLKRKDRRETESAAVERDSLKTSVTSDPVSIEIHPSDTLPPEVKPVSILKQPKSTDTPPPTPHTHDSGVVTCHSVLVHESPKEHEPPPPPVNNLRGQVIKSEHSSSKSPFVSRLISEPSLQNNVLSEGQATDRPHHSPVIPVPHSRSRAASRWIMAIEDVKAKRRKETLSKFLQLSRSLPSYSSSSMARMQVRDLSPFCPFNMSKLASPSQPPRDLSPWRRLREVVESAAGGNVLKPESPAGNVLKPESPAGNVLKPESPTGNVLKPKSPAGNVLKPKSPAGNVLKPRLDTEIKALKPSFPDVLIASPSSASKELLNTDFKNNVRNDFKTSDLVDKEKQSKDQKRQFLTAPQFGRSLSADSRPQNSIKTCHRSNSASSEPAPGGTQERSGDTPTEQKTVPLMGTSVQQIYRRTFTPKRKKSVENNESNIQTSKTSPPPETDDAVKQSSSDGKETKPQNGQDLSPDRQTLSPDRQTLSPERRTLSLSPDRSSYPESAISDNSELGRTLERRGRESQRRRYHGRSFRRKQEKEEDEAEVKTKDDEEPNPVFITRIAVEMCDKSTQTSDLDPSEKQSKLLSKLKKNNKKNKKIKQAALLVHEHPVKEEKLVTNASKENENVEEPPAEDKTPVVESEAKDETPKEETKDDDVEEKNQSPKPKPKKLSFAAIVLLKAKLAKRKKQKEEDEDKNKKVGDADIPYDIFTIENEINLKKLAEIKETDILDDEIVEPDVSIEIPRKKLRFETIPSDEPVQSEEPLPPFRPRMSSRRNSTMREKRKKCLHCCKRFTAFLFSHIGLCSLVVAYTIMGGFIFKAIEGPFEEKTKIFIRSEREHVTTKVLQHAIALQLSDIGRDNFTNAVREQLQAFQQIVFKETKDHGWDGKDAQSDVPEQQWSFASSLLYAITVMTTIGE